MRILVRCLAGAAVVSLGCAGQSESELRHDVPNQQNQQTASPGGTGGASSSGGPAAASGLGLGGALVLNDPSQSPPAPVYSRECINAALGRSTLSGLDRMVASAGAPNQAGNAALPLAAAGATAVNPTAAELGLGAGDLTVLVLFDQSGSMSGGWDERSKWQVANEALMNALEPVLDLVTIGTIFFPQPNGCSVAALDSGEQLEFMSGRNFRARWEATATSRGPDGSTPLGLALQVADMAIERACQLGLLERRFRVVIVTDGEPNCGVDVDTLPTLPAEWRRLGVETRVMGLPGSQGALELMDSIAAAGGTERCLSLGTPQQMHSSMQQALL